MLFSFLGLQAVIGKKKIPINKGRSIEEAYPTDGTGLRKKLS